MRFRLGLKIKYKLSLYFKYNQTVKHLNDQFRFIIQPIQIPDQLWTRLDPRFAWHQNGQTVGLRYLHE